jgi:hypothetical protein
LPPIASRQRSATCAVTSTSELELQRVGDRAQQLVAGGVAAGVVDRLEVVEVEDHGAERRAVAARAGDLLADADLHRAVVEDAGERVGAGDVLDVLVGLGVAAGERGQAGDRLGRVLVLVVDAAARGPAHGQHAAHLAVPGHRHGEQRLGGVGQREVGGVVVLDDGRAGGEHAPRDALAGLDADAVPALRDAVAGGRDRALLGVAQEDAREVGVEGQCGLVDEREQDLLQVERRVERVGHPHDDAVLRVGLRAARLLLEAGEAGGGGVRGELGAGDVLRGDRVMLVPADDQDAAHLVGPDHRDEQRGRDAVQRRAAGDDRGARRGVVDHERFARRDHVRGAGGAFLEAQELLGGLVGCPRPVLGDVEQPDEARVQHLERRGLERSADRLGVGRSSGLSGETIQRTHVIWIIDRTRPPFRDRAERSGAPP